MHNEVIVIKVWPCFHLVKVADVDGKIFCVDRCALTDKADCQ